MKPRWTLVLGLLTSACQPATVDDTGPDDPGCHDHTPADADRVRKVVVALPYDADGQPASAWEVLDLSPDGELSETGTSFQMGRGFQARVAFTPGGRIGLVAQQDGTIGAFRFEDDEVVVVHEGFGDGELYASGVVVTSGDTAWAVDGNWRENGGGLRRLEIGCDGTLALGDHLPGKLPAGLVAEAPPSALVAAHDLLDSAPGDDVFRVDLESGTILSATSAFPDDDASIASSALTSGRDYFLVGDNSEFSGIPNRIAVVAVGDGLEHVQTLELLDPVSLIPSPNDATVLAVSGYGDAIHVLAPTGDPSAPYAASELPYSGGAPQLPDQVVVIDRGSLAGLALISENTGVRRVRFTDGGAEDLGTVGLGSGLDRIVGGIGVQP